MKHIRRSLRVLLITNGLVLLAGAMLGPIYAIFVGGIGGDLMDASIAGGLFALSAGITSLVFGRIADGIKTKKSVLALGYLIMGVGFFLYLGVDSISKLFAVQILIGLGEAIYSPAFDALYSESTHKKQSGYEWGLWECLNYFSMALGAFLGGIIVTQFSFDAIFITMGSFCLCSSIYLYLVSKKVLK
ncbi:MFS transporter [Candidatus Gracilibacteria bacterium]|nr:MFS transporter [Candidatus Gracilibacteria bacterium]